MKTSTLTGAPAGAGVFRDTRAWHGATPNLSREVRAMPNVEYGPAWRKPMVRRSMPFEIWQTLGPHAQKICSSAVCEPGKGPPGAGVMHPLLSEREKARRG